MSRLESTRLSLHAVAELLLAGPQFDLSTSIELRAVPGGFATTTEPDVRVEGTSLVGPGGSVPLHGRTVAAVAEEIGLRPRQLDDVYSGGCGLTAEHSLSVDPEDAAQIAGAFEMGDQALQAFSPGVHSVLWPEHFDIGITVAEVNYGVSPGDSYLGVPYVYVGPWQPAEVTGAFWNAPFGAARPMSDFADAEAVLEFLREGESLTRA
jgi:hypothetical protein